MLALKSACLAVSPFALQGFPQTTLLAHSMYALFGCIIASVGGNVTCKTS